MINEKQKYFCPECNCDMTNMVNWNAFLDQYEKPMRCSGCNIKLELQFEEFSGEAEEYIKFYFSNGLD